MLNRITDAGYRVEPDSTDGANGIIEVTQWAPTTVVQIRRVGIEEEYAVSMFNQSSHTVQQTLRWPLNEASVMFLLSAMELAESVGYAVGFDNGYGDGQADAELSVDESKG